jgi:hypothetical protein
MCREVSYHTGKHGDAGGPAGVFLECRKVNHSSFHQYVRDMME